MDIWKNKYKIMTLALIDLIFGVYLSNQIAMLI